jgi:hypothetical protein
MSKYMCVRSTRLRSFLAIVGMIAMLSTMGLARPTALLADGRTSVNLSSDFLGALSTLRVSAAAVGEGSLRSGVASFPITTGALDLASAKGEIDHAGGLALTAGNTTVQLISFKIDTTAATPVLTGLVIVNGDVVGRLPLFDLQLPALTLPLQPGAFGTVFVPGVGVKLNKDAAAALNQVFGVTAFVEGFNIGQASVFATTGRRSPFTRATREIGDHQ